MPLAVQRILFDSFSSPFTSPLLSGLTEVCFARKMHTTTQFDKTVLSKCVTHNPFRHDVVSPSGNTFLGRSLDPRLDL